MVNCICKYNHDCPVLYDLKKDEIISNVEGKFLKLSFNLIGGH